MRDARRESERSVCDRVSVTVSAVRAPRRCRVDVTPSGTCTGMCGVRVHGGVNQPHERGWQK